MADICGYDEPWVGFCKEESPCSKHGSYTCWKCGEKATRGCTVASSLVCGVPCCDEHPHEDTHYSRYR